MSFRSKFVVWPFATFLERRERRNAVSYTLAFLVTVLAVVARTSLSPVLGLTLPFVTFYVAVSVSAWFGGLGPGVLSTALGACTATYFWLAPTGSFRISATGDVLVLGGFLFVGVLVSVLFEGLHRTRAQAQVAAKEQKRLYREALEANRLKDDFLATLSHELRTPLTAILGWARILHGRPLDASTARAVEVIARNAEAQIRLIEDLLDVSRIITGKLELNLQAVDLSTIIDAAVESIRPATEAKRIRLDCSADPSTPLVRGDPHRLQQVIWNLLSNAVKFSRRGGRVGVTLRRVGSSVHIGVTDTGVGIRREILPFVFDRFRQGDSSTTRAYGGLGLGLAVVRHLVELHGGTVHADSAGEARGATFSVTLPIAAALAVPGRQTEQLLQPLGREPLDVKGLRVLVVDDEADARDLVTYILEASGMAVTSASSVAEALDLIGAVNPHVLVADIGMPDADGYALISAVRARGVHVPALALTAYARVEDRRRALAAGFQAHVVKPVEPGDLVKLIAELAGSASTI